MFLGQGTDYAGGRRGLGWRAAIVEPGSDGREEADVEKLGEMFRRRMGVLPLLLLLYRHRCGAVADEYRKGKRHPKSHLPPPEDCFSTFKNASLPLRRNATNQLL